MLKVLSDSDENADRAKIFKQPSQTFSLNRIADGSSKSGKGMWPCPDSAS